MNPPATAPPPPTLAQAAVPVCGGHKRTEQSSGTDPKPAKRAEAHVQPRPAKRARVAVPPGDLAPSTRPTAASTNDAVWEHWLAKLKAYKQNYGDCNVPARCAEDLRLAGWVHRQRKYKKALDRGNPSKGMTVARAAKLDALGFAWELSVAAISKAKRDAAMRTPGYAWEAQLAKLKAYAQNHGDCNVPGRCAEDPRLGKWVSRQRMNKKALDRGEPSEGMTAVRAAKLETLGFAWKLSAAALSKQRSKGRRDDAGWEGWLAKLKEYRGRHGDCNVPQGWAEDPALGRWANNQRYQHGIATMCSNKPLDHGEPSMGMTAARVAKLEALGFNWGPQVARGGACAHSSALPPRP
jgi:hypothetical protein